MDFFTSDLHIGHDKEFIWGPRGFYSVKEHDREILKRWNSQVSPDDNVYILGDLCLGQDEKEWNQIFYNLNGHKFFIYGNHDTDSKINRYILDYDMTALGYASKYRYDKKRVFYLSHYPTIMGNFEDKRFLWNLSGHTHNQNPFQFGTYKVYNVALDAHQCYPVSIEHIIKDINRYSSNITF